MTVHCPHCTTGYRLPDQLLGERGARVHCPSCGGSFLLLRERDGSVRIEPPPRLIPGAQPAAMEPAATASAAPSSGRPAGGGRASAGPSSSKAPEEPGRVAAELLDSLAARHGDALQGARARGRLLAEFGPDMMRAYEEYRLRLGENGAPRTFRDAVRERWGVDLSPALHPAAE